MMFEDEDDAGRSRGRRPRGSTDGSPISASRHQADGAAPPGVPSARLSRRGGRLAGGLARAMGPPRQRAGRNRAVLARCRGPGVRRGLEPRSARGSSPARIARPTPNPRSPNGIDDPGSARTSRRSSRPGRLRRLLEAEEEVLLELRRVRASGSRRTRPSSISLRKTAWLARTCFEDERRALALDAVELDHDQPAAGPERPADRGQRLLRLLQVVVDVAQEDQVDRLRRAGWSSPGSPGR